MIRWRSARCYYGGEGEGGPNGAIHWLIRYLTRSMMSMGPKRLDF